MIRRRLLGLEACNLDFLSLQIFYVGDLEDATFFFMERVLEKRHRWSCSFKISNSSKLTQMYGRERLGKIESSYKKQTAWKEMERQNAILSTGSGGRLSIRVHKM
jgi:hypothetical protein